MTAAATGPSTCTALAIHLGDLPRGTAPVTRLWLAIEDPGPWGPAGLTDATIDRPVAEAIEERARGAGVRIQLVRRRHQRRDHGRTVLLARSVPTGTWLRRWRVEDPVELLDLAWDELDRDRPPDVGEPADGPEVLVCTHARRDACCARYGRPVMAAALAMAPHATWETSHTGGHRFAGNLVLLPEGIVYGRLEPGDVAHLLDTHRRGLIDLPRYRGRSAQPRAVQAAEWFLRDRLRLTGLTDVQLLGDPPADADGGRVTFRADGRRLAVTVEQRRTGTPRALSCDAAGEDPGTWRLVAIDELSGPTGA